MSSPPTPLKPIGADTSFTPTKSWIYAGVASIAVTVAAFGVASVFFRDVMTAQYDDSYITYRYAWNLFQGNGLVFNPGDRVNSASSLLYTVILAIFASLGLDAIPRIGLGIGILALVSTLALFVAYGYQLRRSLFGLMAGLAGAFIVVMNATNIYWALSGMETALFNLLLGVSLVLATLKAMSAKPGFVIMLVVSLGLLALTRPEGIAIAIAIAVGWLIRARSSLGQSWLKASIPLLSVGLVVAIFLGFNWHYYGEVVPNSVVFKTISDYYTTGIWENAWALGAYGGIRLGVLPIALAAGGLVSGILWNSKSWSSAATRMLPALLGGIAILLFLLFASYSDQFRYQTPLSIFAAWCVTQWAAADGVLGKHKAQRFALPLLAGLMVLLGAWQVLVADRINRTITPFLPVQHAREEMGRWLEVNSDSGTRVLSGDLGSIAFWNPSNFYIDASGLTNGKLVSDLLDGVPYSSSIRSQKPEILVDTTDPEGSIGSVQVFNNPSDYYDPKRIAVSTDGVFDEYFRLTPLHFLEPKPPSWLSVGAWRLTDLIAMNQ